LKFVLKIKWFLLIIFVVHSFSGVADFEILKISRWNFSLGVSYAGIEKGLIMSSKLLSMLLITQIVRFSMLKEEFVKGISGLGFSSSTAQIIDDIIEIVNIETQNKKGGNGKGGGKNKSKNGDKAIDVLLKGKVGNIPNKMMERLSFSKDKFKDSSNANIGSSALAITLIRMVKIAPGLPLAPGHKNILVIPVFIHGISKSEKKFAGAQIGTISGVLHFSMGFGKFGPLGILEFTLLGFVIDLLLKLPIKNTNLVYLMTIGAIAGIVRIGTEILIAYILGISSAFFLLYLPYIISQISFGIASGFISRAIIKKNENE
jgi:hypothetical protein